MAAQTSHKNNTICRRQIREIFIPMDLFIEILLRLPIKSLIRFRAVSKSLKLLLNSPMFIRKHLHAKIRPQSLLVIPAGDRFKKDNNLPFDVKYGVGSCNGIICFETRGPNPLVLFNPSTREFCFLPKECKAKFYGFCYFSQTQEYKVFGFTLRCERQTRNTFADMIIVTMGKKTNSFRKVKDIIVPHHVALVNVYHTPRVAICETCMVWLGFDPDLSKLIVVCYDVIEDRFSKMGLPQNPTNQKLSYSLGVLNNSVIICVYLDKDPTYFDIWTLINDGGSKDKRWMKYKKIGPSKAHEIMYPIHVSPNLKWIFFRNKYDYFACGINQLFYYDLETNQVINYEAEDSQVKMRYVVEYVESIVSPKGICSRLISAFKAQEANLVSSIHEITSIVI